nr:TetR/AcrR family transcriptional regulator [Rhodococcus sp. (in: high G+C Gram-positive bacteria)]
MVSRAESAAATRRALLDDAAELLDSGGPGAVTLREVGARAGVSRGAPYRHFVDKESLLTAVAAEAWEHLGDRMQALRGDNATVPAEALRGDNATVPAVALRAALAEVIAISRRQPYLYDLMFRTPTADPAAVVRAAQRMCDEFAAIVTTVVGEQDAERCASVLLTGAHGAAGLESSGLLTTDKWQTNADDLIDTLIAAVTQR